MHRPPIRLALLPATLLLFACSSFVEPTLRETNRAIQSERLEYVLHGVDDALTTTIGFEYTNRTGRTVYVVNCNGASAMVLEQRVGDAEWVRAWTPAIPLCLSEPIEIAPGETFASEIRILVAGPSSSGLPRLEVQEIEGIYRLHWSALVHGYDTDRPGFGDPLPVAERLSNSILIRLE